MEAAKSDMTKDYDSLRLAFGKAASEASGTGTTKTPSSAPKRSPRSSERNRSSSAASSDVEARRRRKSAPRSTIPTTSALDRRLFAPAQDCGIPLNNFRLLLTSNKQIINTDY